MLKIIDQEYYDRVVAFADKKGLKAKLDERIEWLRGYADHEGTGRCVVELYKDFAPASFYLLWKMPNKEGMLERVMNGGCIFHGDQTGWDEKGEYVDPFNVRLVADENPWSIAT